MSGLDFLSPIGLAALVAIPAIIVFHMRHVTPRRKTVPILRFWQIAAPVRTEEPKFRIPPLSLTMLLQILAASAIAFGLAQPVIASSLGGLTQPTEPVHLVLLIDGSTSMLAQDTNDGQTRFELARQDALTRLGDLRQGDTATVIVLGTQNTTLSAADAGEFKSMRERLQSLPQPGGIADLNATLALVTDLAVPEMQENITLYSDGAVSADPAVIAALPGSLTWKEYGRATTPNLAITDIVPKSALGGSGNIDLYLQIANYSDNPVDTVLLVQADGVEIERENLTVEPTRPSDVTIRNLAPGTQKVVAEVQSNDSLFADNQATIMFADQGGSALSVLLVSDLPGASQRALAAVPGTVVTTTGSQDYANRTVSVSDFDLVAFDGTLPPSGQVPDRPVLFIDPPRGGILPDKGMITIPQIESIRTDDPIMNGVDLAGVTFRETPAFALDTTSIPVVESQEGPLLFRGVAPESGQPMIVLAFDLADSNLPNRIAFPILMSNIISVLAPGALPLTLPLGEALKFSPRPQASTVQITDPMQSVTDLSVNSSYTSPKNAQTPESLGVNDIVFTSTGVAGAYTVVEYDSNGRSLSSSVFTVNAGHPSESRLIANRDLQSVLATSQAKSDKSLGKRANDLWPLLLIIALVALLLEWLWTTASRRFRRRPASTVYGNSR